ncbi:MAG: Glycosyl transferase family 2 [candidate division BRC1 bacterium ADurb.BinA292]|nr:MAG: Glycosyl transferase family 2 [candidate division BRC1 bacterium ADurb.BinA292]
MEGCGSLNIQYVLEPKVGLSRARNTALALCRTEYLVYLDDDAKPLPFWMDAIEEGIARWHPPFFGGPYRPYYLGGKPRWFADSYGSMHYEKQEGPLPLNGFLSGGNMGWRVELIRSLGGFPEHLGMIDTRIGVGEETYLQLALKERGNNGYFFPRMEILHFMAPEKMSLSYRARRMWQSGLQARATNLGRSRARLRTLLYSMVFVPIHLAGMLFRDRAVDPCWQGYVYRRILPHLTYWGEFWARLSGQRSKVD